MTTQAQRRVRRAFLKTQQRAHDETLSGLERLRLVYECGVHLVQYADHIARQARKEGATWEEIGDAVGITKQGAQRRWG